MQIVKALQVLLGPGMRTGRRRPDGPLRIALIIESVLLGGAEVVVSQLAEELRQRGHRVFPVAPEGRDGWLRATLVDAGFPWHTYSLPRPISWSCAENLARTMAGLGIEVSHGHEFTASIYGAAAAQLAGIPHIITMHGNQQMTRKYQRRVALRWAFRRSAATLAVSHDTRRHLERTLGLPPGVVGVVHNGVPDRPGRRERFRGELGLREDQVLVLAVGSLVERKGHRVLLEAMAGLRDDPGMPAWKVAIAGEGPEREALEAQIRQRGLEGRAVLLGARDDVADLQAAADLFVMPSLWEGLPLAILEAMFAENAIIATATSGIPEALTHDEDALLVPPGDATALATALRRLVEDPDARRTLGRRARRQAERRFSIGAMTDAYERIYRGHRPPTVPAAG